MNVVYDCGTIKRYVYTYAVRFSISAYPNVSSLSTHLIARRHGIVAEGEDEEHLMRKLAEEYGRFADFDQQPHQKAWTHDWDDRSPNPQVVVRLQFFLVS